MILKCQYSVMTNLHSRKITALMCYYCKYRLWQTEGKPVTKQSILKVQHLDNMGIQKMQKMAKFYLALSLICIGQTPKLSSRANIFIIEKSLKIGFIWGIEQTQYWPFDPLPHRPTPFSTPQSSQCVGRPFTCSCTLENTWSCIVHAKVGLTTTG